MFKFRWQILWFVAWCLGLRWSLIDFAVVEVMRENRGHVCLHVYLTLVETGEQCECPICSRNVLPNLAEETPAINGTSRNGTLPSHDHA